jgi:DNA-binding transcriptional ArsR family regulator
VVALRGSEVDAIFETLSSDTRRNILKTLYEEPSTPSELAAATDTSLQNVHYHVEKLIEVDLIEAIDTRYSEKGKEMNVYAPTNDPLIFVESEETRSRVESSLERIVGVLSLLAIGSLLVQYLASVLRSPAPRALETASDGSFSMSAQADTVQTGTDLIGQAQSALLEPGALVFIGGLVAILGFLLVRRING